MLSTAQISRTDSESAELEMHSASPAVSAGAPKRVDAKNSASPQLLCAKPAHGTEARRSSTLIMATGEERLASRDLSDVNDQRDAVRGGASLARARENGSSSSRQCLVSPPSTKTTASLKLDSTSMAHADATGKTRRGCVTRRRARRALR